MMEDAIRNLNAQFAFVPEIKNRKAWKPKKKFLVCGMGGSHLAADLLRNFAPSMDVVIHKDYGLPPLQDLRDRFVVLCSFSGNTEEVIDAFNAARRNKLAMGVVAKGGELIRLAEKHGVPYVRLPEMGLQPRSATGLMTVGFLALLGEKNMLRAATRLAKSLKPAAFEKQGGGLASRLRGKVPIIYSSSRNWAVAEIIKIRMNETGKIPAFWNVIPELNHNEMTSFDVVTGTRALSRNFHFVILEDAADHPKNRRRMKVLKKLLEERGFGVDMIVMEGRDPFQKVFGTLLIGDWAALRLSEYYDTEAEQVPMVEEFKHLIA